MKKIMWLLLLGAGISVALLNACSNAAMYDNAIPDVVSYNYDVRPILSDKCFNCHGPDAQKREAGLRLDIASEAFKALQEHPQKHALVPGNPEASELFARITTTDTSLLMPKVSSKLPRLSEHEVEILKKWIAQGAKYEPHWAFVVPQKAALPAVNEKSWPVNEIDYFILSKMERQGLSPNETADKERLLKRVCMDLTGILPTPEQTAAFVNDASANAYEKQVDRLLQLPQFGEKMAIGWMDLARFADSHGFQDDSYRSQWPWRDWVIDAFNRNMRYDTFITWQLAGDLLPNATKEQQLASGFNRNHKITEEGGVIDEEYRVQYVTDRTNTFGRAMLAMTVECAKCHDHKYDPFSQKNYYQLYAFFNNVKEVGLEATVGGPETYAKNPRMTITNEEVQKTLRFINKKDTGKLEVSVMADRDTTRKTFLLIRGNYDTPGEEVRPATPPVVLPFDSTRWKTNRLGLAQWMFDEKNPLTARVFVNRIWQEFFGRGIVKTASDFGMQGDLPSNPPLLDWLAADFQQHGWDMKRLIRQLVLSATYRQSGKISTEKLKKDPLNIYLSYAPRARFSAELVRDILLSSSGLLNTEIGGPSVKPLQPPGLWELATSGRGILKKYVQDTGTLLYRRGLYTFIKRTVPPPSMMIFDASNRDECQTSRYRTNTPLQALVMLNDPTMIEASKALADRLLQRGTNPTLVITGAFQRIICRTPDAKEKEVLVSYWEQAVAELKKNPENAHKIISVGNYQAVTKDIILLAAAMQAIQVMYNMQEAITKT
ncbi:MAG: PSD1 and planctomycete cytochrome C domain-containing protein [Chitinophagia bacterium]